MSNRKKLTGAGQTRRRFIERTTIALMGTSAAFMTRGMAGESGIEESKVSPTECADMRTPMRDVAGKVAFITGGSSGIGLGIAQEFIGAGMKVAIGYRTDAHLEAAMKILGGGDSRAHAIRVDVTDRSAMEKAAREVVQVFGKVHVLVNNAGVALPGSFSDTNYELWDWLLNVNVNGPFNGVRAFLPLIQAHGEGGQVITTSSIMGLFATAGGAAYIVSKFAVIGMMEALRQELANSGTGVSILIPGLVKSEILASSWLTRPANSGAKVDDELLRRDKQTRADPEAAMDPLEVGRLALRGMRNNDLYIMTHPEYEQIIQDRSEALIGSLPRHLQVSDKRVAMARLFSDKSIYAAERDRQLCARKSVSGR